MRLSIVWGGLLFIRVAHGFVPGVDGLTGREWSSVPTTSALHLSGASRSMEPLDPQRKRPTALEKPPVTETSTPLPELDKLPVSHKIVVLGATGKVGRLVVRQLLEESPEGTTVVAVVRDYDKVRIRESYVANIVLMLFLQSIPWPTQMHRCSLSMKRPAASCTMI